MKKMRFTFLLLLIVSKTFGQTIYKPPYLNYPMDSSVKTAVLTALDTLFSQLKNDKLDTVLLGKGRGDFNVLKSFKGMEDNKKDSIANFYKKQLINIYPISENQYWLSLAFIGAKPNEPPILRAIINLVATNNANQISFATPLSILTKNWQSKQVGNVMYYFRDKINLARANKFNEKNGIIATKLGLPPEKFKFYMCNNYQEILQILGFEYDSENNGVTREGYGVDNNTIFSIMNNEDFSHDLFHYYSDKFRQMKGNRTVEEGIAYSWGNAYYPTSKGEMIEQSDLVKSLKLYLKENPTASLFQLFTKDTKIFNSIAKEISVKSTIASLLCDEVERQKGIEGIKTMIKCGRGDDNLFKTLESLIAVNAANFDQTVLKLIANYRK